MNERSTARVSYADAAIWHRFEQAETDEDHFRLWLTLLVSMMPSARRAVLLLSEPGGGPLRPAAYWPEGAGGRAEMGRLVERCVEARKGLVEILDEPSDGQQHAILAQPIVHDGRVDGAVAIEVVLATGSTQALEGLLRQMHWGTAWVVARRLGEEGRRDAVLAERLMGVIDLLATTLEQDRFVVSAGTFVGELARRLPADRVSLGLLHRAHARVQAISNTAQVTREMRLVRALGRLMDEAIDQHRPLVFPETGQQDHVVLLREHAGHARDHDMAAIATLPLHHAGEVVGALSCERCEGPPFSEDELDVLQAVAALAGPVLHARHENDRWLGVKVVNSVRRQLVRLFGPEYLVRKLVVATITGLGIALATIQGTYRVTAETAIEGAIQRLIVSPMDGFIDDCPVRAGDRVAAGDVLCRLDDRDLRLEQVKWTSERAKYLRKRDEARAKGDRAELNVLQAQIEQAEARLALVDERLSRLAIKAPFDGLVISGDMSRRLGGAVKRGEVLFELAPLGDYRVMLAVDEHDISAIRIGQTGRLVLSSRPGTPLDITVVRLVPLARAEEGRNTFPVEARLESPGRLDLRPGMKGVAKIAIDRRTWAWIGGHEILDRLRLWWWRWSR